MICRTANSHRLFAASAAVPVLVVFGLASGCGYSTHDEYTHIRSINVAAQPGDGTIIASRAAQPVLQQAMDRPSVAVSTPRGRATDQPSPQ